MVSSTRQFHFVNWSRFLLPIILFLIVFLYEAWEHVLLEDIYHWDIHFTSEVLFFGIVGPVAVFFVLTMVVALLKDQMASTTELEILNRSLEKMVIERTRELKHRNEELARANTELQELDLLKSDFVSLVSHELRGPLTTLNGGLEMALQNVDELSPQARHILEVISRESRHLTHYVQTILDVSRLEAGNLKFNLGPVAIAPLIHRTVETVLAASARQVNWRIPADLPPVWADEVYLGDILSNLITNADKYSPQDQPVAITAEARDGLVEIQVIDHGPGIPPEKMAQIFKRFQRLERGDRIQTRGWGLGLYFARALAEGQGAQLDVESPVHPSRDAPGAAFKITMPATGDVPSND